jgi:hypothetical protein
MGFCGQCLDEASLNGAPLGWQRSWMHPMAVACEKHRSWLEPVAIGRLREIRTSSDFGLLPRTRSFEWSAPELRREALLIDGALWFQVEWTVHDEVAGSDSGFRGLGLLKSHCFAMGLPAGARWSRGRELGGPARAHRRRTSVAISNWG